MVDADQRASGCGRAEEPVDRGITRRDAEVDEVAHAPEAPHVRMAARRRDLFTKDGQEAGNVDRLALGSGVVVIGDGEKVESLGARRTVAKINDPVRAEAYAHLGIATLCRTNLMTESVLGFLGQAAPGHPGIYAPERPHLHPPEAEVPAGPARGTPTTEA